MPFTTILSTSELAQHLEDPDWVLVDCRFDLMNFEWGFQDYQRAHIPGAVYAHFNNDLAAPITPQTGRHPLPETVWFNQRLSSWGIDSTRQVVAYDTAGGSNAARLWWMLRRLGHEAVAVLDGSFQKWLKEGRPTRSGVEQNTPTVFQGQPNPQYAVDAATVEAIRLDPHFKLIDARIPARFLGEQEPIDAVAGHIPGAVNRFHGNNLSADGTFLPAEELRKQFLALLKGVSPTHTVVYCGSGVTSCHNLLAMEIAGLPGARLYPGSWSEWIRDPARPQAQGPE